MNRSLAVLVIVSLGLVAACSVTHRVAVPGPATPASPGEIVGITTNAGVEVDFDRPAAVQGDKLVAQVKHKPYEIAQAEIQRYWVQTRTHSTARTIGLVAGITVGVAAVVAIAVVVTASASRHINVPTGGLGGGLG